MLEFIYITHFQSGKQKSLAYAFRLAKAFSSPLSLLPISRFKDPLKGKIQIWQSRKEIPVSESEGKHFSKKESLPVFLLGKSGQLLPADIREYQIIAQILHSGFPIFLLPYDYSYNRIRKILFTGNAPGFTDHQLKHQLAATFQARAYKIGSCGLEAIHWNNICHISASVDTLSKVPFKHLQSLIRQHQIDLTIFPVTPTFDLADYRISSLLGHLYRYDTPVLLIPPTVKELRLKQAEENHTNPLLLDHLSAQIELNAL